MKANEKIPITNDIQFRAAYDRLFAWRDLWQRLSNRDSVVYPSKDNSGLRRSKNAVFLASLQARQEKIEYRAKLADNNIRYLIDTYDDFKTQRDKLPELSLRSTGACESWSLVSCLEKLIEAADILLHWHNYDGHGHEEILIAMNQAKTYITESGYQK